MDAKEKLEARGGGKGRVCKLKGWAAAPWKDQENKSTIRQIEPRNTSNYMYMLMRRYGGWVGGLNSKIRLEDGIGGWERSMGMEDGNGESEWRMGLEDDNGGWD